EALASVAPGARVGHPPHPLQHLLRWDRELPACVLGGRTAGAGCRGSRFGWLRLGHPAPATGPAGHHNAGGGAEGLTFEIAAYSTSSLNRWSTSRTSGESAFLRFNRASSASVPSHSRASSCAMNAARASS